MIKANTLTIASPCEADWDAMTGDAARRFCGDCQKNVHNISEMTEAKARSLIETACEGELCVRYREDLDGNVIFKAPNVRLSDQWAGVRRLIAASALVLPLLAGPVTVAAQNAEPAVIELEMMGDIAYEPEPEKPNCEKEEASADTSWALDLVQRAMAMMGEDAAKPHVVEPTVKPEPVIVKPAIMGRMVAPGPKMGGLAPREFMKKK